MSTRREEYKVQLEVFEGPLDLLLYLIRKEEIDIYDIPIERVTAQYLQYLDLMRVLDLDIAGEFLVMAATLLMIKSRMLLPPEERPVPDAEDEEEADPRWDLVRQLVEYKKFKDAAFHLHRMEEQRLDVFVREGDTVRLGAPAELPLQEVGIFDLLSAFNQALRRVDKEELKEIFSEQFTVEEKIDELLGSLRTRARLSLHALFEGMRSRHEIVVTFLAMLELIRLRRLSVRQKHPFGEIFVEKAAEA